MSYKRLFCWIIAPLALSLTLPSSVLAISEEDFAQLVARLPSLLETRFPNPKNPHEIVIKNATCFVLKIDFGGISNAYILSNYHPFTLRDSTDKIITTVDSGRVYRNARDTVVTLRVKLLLENPALDLALLEILDSIPSEIEATGIKVVMTENEATPGLSEKVLYSGFPLLLVDTIKQNQPMVLFGQVALTKPNSWNFIVQAPIFSGASGSPIMSLKDGRFLGIVYGRLEAQESLLLAVTAYALKRWLRSILPPEFQK